MGYLERQIIGSTDNANGIGFRNIHCCFLGILLRIGLIALAVKNELSQDLNFYLYLS